MTSFPAPFSIIPCPAPSSRPRLLPTSNIYTNVQYAERMHQSPLKSFVRTISPSCTYQLRGLKYSFLFVFFRGTNTPGLFRLFLIVFHAVNLNYTHQRIVPHCFIFAKQLNLPPERMSARSSPMLEPFKFRLPMRVRPGCGVSSFDHHSAQDPQAPTAQAPQAPIAQGLASRLKNAAKFTSSPGCLINPWIPIEWRSSARSLCRR